MFSWLVGTQGCGRDCVDLFGNRGGIQSSTDDIVREIARALNNLPPKNPPTRVKGCPFSPLRFVWIASLMVGVHGQRPVPFPAQFELSNLDGTNGFFMKGEQAGDRSGLTVSGAGDVNGDGIGDLVIGSRHADPSGKAQAGKTYVVFGSRSFKSLVGGGGSLELKSLNGNNGFILNGDQPKDYSGSSVSGAGDVNGDGIGDLVIGAFGAGPPIRPAAGKSYVVFGSRNFSSLVGNNGTLELSSLNGSNGFILYGEGIGHQSGRSVSSAGDMNGDGLSDILIGAFAASPSGRSAAGKSYVVFGNRNFSNFVSSNGILELSSMKGSNGFILNGDSIGDWSGYSVSSAGDMNGDGLADCVIGAHKADLIGRSTVGKSYVVFGRRNFSSILGSGGSLELSRLNGSNGFILNGEVANDQSGFSVSTAGDVNGDGLADVVIGAFDASPSGRTSAGKSYVVFGRRNFSSLVDSRGTLELSSLDGTNGFILNGEVASDWSGRSVSSAGDVNGDGIEDLVIGASNATLSGKSFAGKSYVLFGSRSFISIVDSGGTLELSSLNGTNGFIFYGKSAGDRLGGSVSGIGDVNGDGLSDLLIGAPGATPSGRTEAGISFVVFGRNLTKKTLPPPLSMNKSSSQLASEASFLTTIPVPSNAQTTLDQGRASSAHLQTIKSTQFQSSLTISLLPQSSESGSTPLIAGITAVVAALACGLFVGGTYYYRKRSTKANDSVETQLENQDQLDRLASNTAIQREKRSVPDSKMHHEYGRFPPSADYVKAPLPEQLYDQVNMEDQNNNTYQAVEESIREQEHVYDSPSSPL